MAIQIPQGYAQSVGAAAQTQRDRRLQAVQNIASQFKTSEEKFGFELDNDIKDSMMPFTQAFNQDVSTWGDIDFSTVKDAGTAYFAFKDRLKGRARRFADRNNLMDPIKFKAAYDSRLNMMIPSIEQKLKGYQLANNVSDDNMRKFIGDNPTLQRMLINSTDPMIVDWATPDKAEGIIPGLAGAVPEALLASSPLVARGVIQGVGQMKDWKDVRGFARGLGRGVRPFVGSPRSVGARVMGGAQAMAPGELPKIGKAGEALAKGDVKKSQKLLKAAQSKYDDALKAYNFDKKGKRIKGKNFFATKKAKEMRQGIEAARKKVLGVQDPKRFAQASKKAGEGVMKKFLKQRGLKGLGKAALKQLGPMGAAKLMGKLAASGLMKVGGVFTGGVTTALSTALDVWTLNELRKVITKTIREESGGLGSPGKMLFGGADEGKMPGQKY